jgi:hypothetical protein
MTEKGGKVVMIIAHNDCENLLLLIIIMSKLKFNLQPKKCIKLAFELTVQELTTSLYKLIPSFAFGDSNTRKVYRPNQELLAGR